MPRITPLRLAAACTLALVLSLTLVAGATAKGVSAELRVVGKRSQVLAEQEVRTGPAISVKTSPKATCFGKGTGGSGKPVPIQPNTAMGALAQAAKSNPALRPLAVSDSFSFGLALCGIGKSLATGGLSWYLKVDHKGAQVSGDKVKLRSGDDVLWALASYPYPNELVLEAPGAVTAGMPFTVHVFSYDEKGKRRPLAGATVTGAAAPTGADGATTVTLGATTALVATHGKEIPSPAADVCVGTPACQQ
ncbi:MAG TPA: hypothetical protein VHI77_10695 [Solirubrobacterales bacterium]|jgi:hypothetical protein|nr:hypothetical protein [Solirubrobacterales bacterium]